MPEFSGSFSGKARVETTIAPADTPDHVLNVAEITGSQNCSDANWSDSRVTYWAVIDVIAGNGTQRGYYVNERANGDRDYGTFEGRVTTDEGKTTLEGTWKASGGSGKFTGLKAQGTYRGVMNSPSEVGMTWSGAYELAAAKAA